MSRGYELKLDRATHHLHDLALCSAKWFDEKRHAIIHERDPDAPYEFRYRVVLREQLPIEPFGLLIGDCLYSLRSALDNLAFELNGGSSVSDRLTNESAFPIFGNENRYGEPCIGKDSFSSNAPKGMRGMCDRAKAVIESLQPYHRGNEYRDDPLWRLNYLCNADKHRMIHPIACAFGGMALFPDKCENFGGMRGYWSHAGPLDAETVVVRYSASPKIPEREVKVHFEPLIGVGFAEGPLYLTNVQGVLFDIYHHIMRNVVERLVEFLPDHVIPST